MPSIKKIKTNAQSGFTLLEVLLVAAIIAILAGIVIIAINPSKNLADSRNTQRKSDVTTILNGIYQYSLDNNGELPTDVEAAATPTEVCATGAAACTSLVDLSVLTTNGTYLVAIPEDPQNGTTGCNTTDGTGYEVSTANGRVTVSAMCAEGETISVTR